MDLSLTDTQVLIRDAVRGFVQREAPRPDLVELADQKRTWNPDWLPHFRRNGWLGVLVPEDLGGAELDTLGTALLFEELGRGAVPSPLLASSAVGASLLRDAMGGAVRDDLLRGVADGTAVVVPALRRPDRSWAGVLGSPLDLTADGDGWTLSGSAVFVPFADAATHALVAVAKGAERGLAVVPLDAPGVSVRGLGGFLHANFEVEFANVRTEDSAVLNSATGDFDAALSAARVALAAYQVGGCAELLDMCVAHSSSRVQFGVPIGRFQRVQDHIIRLLNALDGARWMMYEAAWAVDTGHNGTARSYLAAAAAGEAYIEAANAAHEVHAGIGSDPAFGLTLYTQQSRTLYEFLGPPAWQRREMADAMGWAQ